MEFKDGRFRMMLTIKDINSENMKPCPRCNGKDLCLIGNFSSRYGSRYRVACSYCDLVIPFGKTEEDAIKLWNKIV